jgi:hypothetical protein
MQSAPKVANSLRVHAHLQYNQLKLGDIVGVHPVLGSLSDEVLLPAPSGTIAASWVSSCSH